MGSRSPFLTAPPLASQVFEVGGRREAAYNGTAVESQRGMMPGMAQRWDERLTIETPEHVALYFERASIGNRFLACAVDHGLQLGLVAGLMLAGSALRFLLDRLLPEGGEASVWGDRWIGTLGLVLVFLVFFGYFILFEAFWGGQTPGKRWFHLRVIQLDGRPVTLAGAIARNLLRLADLLIPPFYSVGLLTVFLSPTSQRLGDYLANTVVVRERLEDWEGSPFAAPDRNGARSSRSLGALARPPAPEEMLAVESFLRRREELAPSPRQWLAWRIATPLLERLSPGGQLESSADEDFLEALSHLSRIAEEPPAGPGADRVGSPTRPLPTPPRASAG